MKKINAYIAVNSPLYSTQALHSMNTFIIYSLCWYTLHILIINI